MYSDVAINVKDVSKCYQIYDQPRDRLKQFFLPRARRMIGMPTAQYYRDFWALKNISFQVKRGETVGIVGRNGSGKSTLLQLICDTLNPTTGSIETHGRVAALLELGSGFNPEFTGRENVYLNGAVLGLSRAEIDERLGDILEFADIGQFIDHPVKTYSSGMAVRLAFSVAINVDPKILIIDEALSVGDELFQRKCFSRIESIRSKGTTILFVSHSGGAVVELCDRALLIDSGELLAIGTPKKIVGRYQKLLYAPADRRESIRSEIRGEDTDYLVESITTLSKAESFAENDLPDSYDPELKPTSTIVYESYGAIIEGPSIYSVDDERVNNLSRGKTYKYRYSVSFKRAASNVRFGMMIKTTSGVELGGATSASSPRNSLPFVTAGSVFSIEFRFSCQLNSGIYFLNAGVVGDVNGSEAYLHRLVDVAMFRVMSESENSATGVVDFSCSSSFVQEET